jgi:hypothetical protein
MTNRDRQRITAEGRPVAARSDHAQNVVARRDGGQRHNPTTERRLKVASGWRRRSRPRRHSKDPGRP